MKAYWKYLIIGAAIVVSAWLLARAYTYKYHAQETIVVTGLGETEFSSDLIVWNGFHHRRGAERRSGIRADRIQQEEGVRLPPLERDRC